MSNYSKYPSYKDSGVEWLGEIPEGWNATKMKYNARVYNGNSISDGQKSSYENQEKTTSIPYISTKDLNAKYFTINYDNGLRIPSNRRADFKIARASSSLVCIEGGSAGKKLAYLNENVCFVNKLACIESSKNKEPKYMNYFMHSSLFKYSFELATTGLIPGVSISDLKDIIFLNPPLQEQKAIATYLDRATQKIDTLIAKQSSLIALLREKRQALISHAVTKGLDPDAKMKESGVEWLGEIPEGWEVKKTKNIFSLIIDPAHVNNSYELLSIYTDIGVKPRKDLEQKGNKSTTTDGYWKVKKKDIIVNKLLAWMGAIGVSNYDGVTSPAYDILRAKKGINPDFYHLLFRTKKAQTEFKKWSRGIMEMRLRLYFSEFGQIKMPVPPIDEQRVIVEYIERQTQKIDILITKATEAITLLKEKRTALISAVVTGKIDVRGEVT